MNTDKHLIQLEAIKISLDDVIALSKQDSPAVDNAKFRAAVIACYRDKIEDFNLKIDNLKIDVEELLEQNNSDKYKIRRLENDLKQVIKTIKHSVECERSQMETNLADLYKANKPCDYCDFTLTYNGQVDLEDYDEYNEAVKALEKAQSGPQQKKIEKKRNKIDQYEKAIEVIKTKIDELNDKA